MSQQDGDIDIMVDQINEEENTIIVDMLTLGNFVSQFATVEQVEAKKVVQCFATLTTNEQDGVLEAVKQGSSGGPKPLQLDEEPPIKEEPEEEKKQELSPQVQGESETVLDLLTRKSREHE